MGTLPPLRYWRARTAEEKREATRSGLLQGLLAFPVVLVLVAGLAILFDDPPTWVIVVATLLVIAPFGYWAELRAARRRYQRDSRAD